MTRNASIWLIGSAAIALAACPASAQDHTADARTTTTADPADTTDEAAATDTAGQAATIALKGLRGSTDAPAADSNEIVVTGTRIVRPNMTSNAPVTVIDSTYLKERGLSRVEDALSQLPQVTPILGLQQSTWTSGKAPVGLRNLGPGRTLTLLDGRRMDNDINLVPGALIDRIDIMTGGASAVYGSDAIAGVINFILKRKFNGIAFDGEITGIEHANDNPLLQGIARTSGYPVPSGNYLGGGNYYASLTMGKTLLNDHVNVTVFGTYKRADPVRFSDLDTTNCPLLMFDPNNPTAGNTRWACKTTTYNKYNYFSVDGQDLTNARDGSRAWRSYDLADEGKGLQTDMLQRRNTAINAGGFVNVDLPAGMRLDGSFLYTRSVDRGAVSVDAAFYTGAAQLNCDNPFLGRAQAVALCGAAAGGTTLSAPIAVAAWRPGFTQQSRFTTADWRGSLALSGTIVDKIRFDLNYQQSRNITRGSSDNIYLYDAEDRLARGLQVRNVAGVPTCLSKIAGTDPGCLPIDVFSSDAQISDAVYAWLTGTGQQMQQNDMRVVNGVVSGTLEDYGIKSPLATNGIGFAVNGEYRKYRQQSAGAGAWSNFTTFDGRTSVRELGGEIDIPLVEDKPFFKSLSVNGGYRLSDYDVYDRLVRSWKAEASWAPVDGLRFRASYNRAVRVGVMQRLEGQNRYPNTLALDLCAPPRTGSKVQRYTFDQCAAGGMTRTQYDALTGYTACNALGQCPATLINGGNPDLQPERSRSKTLGVVFQPRALPGFSATVDWYDIDIQGAFQWARWTLAFNQCYDSKVAFFCSLYHRDPQTGQLVEIDARYNNSGYTATRGIDFATSYAIDPKRFGAKGDIGTFNVNLNGTLTTRYTNQFAPNTTAWSCLGYFGFVCGDPMPRWRHVAGFAWQLPWVKGGIGVTWRYIGPTALSKLSSNSVLAAKAGESFPLTPRIAPYSYFDLSANLTLVKGLDVRGSVQNLFDKDPPLIGDDTNFANYPIFNTFPTYYTVRGRALKIGLSAKL